MPTSSHIRRNERPIPPSPGSRHQRSDGWLPPEDTTWVKYSANGEPVISGLASLLLHGALVLLLLTGIFAAFRKPAPPVEEIPPVLLIDGDNHPGSGRGLPGATSQLPGAPRPQLDDSRPLEPNRSVPAGTLSSTTDPKVQPDRGPVIKGDELAEELRKKFADRPDLRILSKELEKALSERDGPGIRGPGPDGGAGGHPGGGVGDKPGPGTGPPTRRERMQRWELVFPVSDARHYLEQLDALAAVVAVPDRSGKLLVIRNLKDRPAQLEYRDIYALNRIYWVDDRRDSTESVARELGLDFIPSAIVAFFPYSFEQELVAKEKAYANRAEANIEFTRFAISFRNGKHVIRVVDQRPLPGKP